MGLENQSFSFFPFGALFCLTLVCFAAVCIFALRYRYRDNKQMDRLKDIVAKGELTETEYLRLKNLLTE